MTRRSKLPSQPGEIARGADLWSLPREEAIAQLMQEFDMSRERAEAILQRDPNDIRRHAMIPVTHEELDRLLEEIARSGENMSIGGKEKPPAEKQQDT